MSSCVRRKGGTPDLEALAEVINGKRGGPDAKASLIAMAEGAWLTQADLYSMGRADTDICQACKRAKGTMLHRLACCPAGQGLREEMKGAEARAIDKAQKADSGRDPLYAYGLPIKGTPQDGDSLHSAWKRKKERQRQAEQVSWRTSPAADQAGEHGIGTFGPIIATDGSFWHAKPWCARVAGWAAVSVNEKGDVLQAAYGETPDLDPTAFKAELRALQRAISYCVPPVQIYSDCRSLVNLFNSGEEACTNARRQGANIWREVWRNINEWGEGASSLFKVSWCKGHF